MRRFIANSLKALAGIVLAVALFEVILILFWPQERQTPLFDSTPTFPLALRRNLDGIHVSSEFSVRYRTNSLRLRDPERPVPKPDGVFRILVLGDSLTFGSGVDDRDTFVRQLERLLNRRGDRRRFEVINAACASWGTAHHLVFLEESGFKLEPDVVLMAFHDDDPNDNRISGFFRLEADGSLVRQAPRRQALEAAKRLAAFVPFYDYLAQHSNLFAVLRLRIVQWIKNLRAPKEGDADFLARRKRLPAVWPEEDWLLTERLCREVRDRCRKNGARLALLHVPYPGKKPRPEFNRAVEQRFIRIAESLGLPHLELIDRLAESAPGDPNYFPRNRHFTPRGHRLIAEALARFLERGGLLE